MLCISFLFSCAGVIPTCARASVGAGSELATYDEIKQQLVSRGIVASGSSLSGLTKMFLISGTLSLFGRLQQYRRVPTFSPYGSVCCARAQRTGAAARLSLRLARLPPTASSAQRSRRIRSTRAAAPVLLAHAEVTESTINIFQWVQNLGTPRCCTVISCDPCK